MGNRKLLWVFVDGLGIGRRDPAVNPLARFEPKVLRLFEEGLGPFPGNGICLPTDACLGVPGLPQSATGQTTLFTGLNAARLAGGHQAGFPDRQLRQIIADHSVLVRLRRQGRPVTFANVYTPRFFSDRPRWVSVTTVMAESSGIPLRTMADLHADRGLFMDYTNRLLTRRGYEAPLRSPEDAAAVLADLAPEFSLCLYEYFLTDVVGHRGTLEEAETLLRDLDRFLHGLVKRLEGSGWSLLVSSDHGNVEDKSVRQHTRNLVPTMIWGAFAEWWNGHPRQVGLQEVAPRVLQFLEDDPPDRRDGGMVWARSQGNPR